VIELLPLSVGIGLVISLLFAETFGLAAGGMIVPGYVALRLTHPLDVVATVAAGLATWAIVRGVSSFAIVFGRRRTVLMILVGYLVGMLVRWSGDAFGHQSFELEVIGFIIPGLIALWLDRQGIVETIAALVTASVVVRLILVLVVGAELVR
jgi:poly-gamma-glutamate biosynthesis protein PgsC/CapC